MTLFFLILLTVSLSIFGFQKLKKKTKLTIKPSLPKVEELFIQELEKPISAPIAGRMPGIPLRAIQPVTPELHKEPKPEWPAPEPVITEPKEPISLPVFQPIISEPENPMLAPEPVKKEDTPEPRLPKQEPIPAPEPIVVEQPLLKPKSVSLPLEEKPIMLSPKEPEPPGNLPTG